MLECILINVDYDTVGLQLIQEKGISIHQVNYVYSICYDIMIKVKYVECTMRVLAIEDLNTAEQLAYKFCLCLLGSTLCILLI